MAGELVTVSDIKAGDSVPGQVQGLRLLVKAAKAVKERDGRPMIDLSLSNGRTLRVRPDLPVMRFRGK